MEQKFELIRIASTTESAQKAQNALICSNLQTIAEDAEIEVNTLKKGVTYLLSNIANRADNGKPIKLMHINSVGAFLAGVEAITQALPSSTDAARQEKTIRVLSTAGIGPDGTVNDAVFPIVNAGARNPNRHRQMTQIVTDYMTSQLRGEPNGRELAQVARKLQIDVDRAMRSVKKPRSFALTGASRAGTAPRSL